MMCLIIDFNLCVMQKPIIPSDLYRAVRDSQLIGMSGYSKEVLDGFLWVLEICVYPNRFQDLDFVLPHQAGEVDHCGNKILISEKDCSLVMICCYSVLSPCNHFQGLPVIAVGVGLSTFDKASVRTQYFFISILASPSSTMNIFFQATWGSMHLNFYQQDIMLL